MWCKEYSKSSNPTTSSSLQSELVNSRTKEVVVRTKFVNSAKSSAKSAKSVTCEIRGEKRKMDTYTEQEVEKIIFR